MLSPVLFLVIVNFSVPTPKGTGCIIKSFLFTPYTTSSMKLVYISGSALAGLNVILGPIVGLGWLFCGVVTFLLRLLRLSAPSCLSCLAVSASSAFVSYLSQLSKMSPAISTLLLSIAGVAALLLFIGIYFELLMGY